MSMNFKEHDRLVRLQDAARLIDKAVLQMSHTHKHDPEPWLEKAMNRALKTSTALKKKTGW